MIKNLIRLTLTLSILLICLKISGQSVLNKFDIIGRQKKIDIPFQYENHFILLRVLLQKSFPLNLIRGQKTRFCSKKNIQIY